MILDDIFAEAGDGIWLTCSYLVVQTFTSPYSDNIADSGGTVFELTPPSSRGGSWTESILWSFGNGSDGVGPGDSLIMDSSSNLYGNTNSGGAFGAGTVFEISPGGPQT